MIASAPGGADYIRWIAIIEIALSIGLMFSMFARSPRWWRPDPFFWLGMAASYTLYAVGSLIELQIRMGTPMTWRTPVLFVAASLGLFVQFTLTLRRPRRKEESDAD